MLVLVANNLCAIETVGRKTRVTIVADQFWVNDGYQSVPVDWTINSERKRGFFQLHQKITTGK